MSWDRKLRIIRQSVSGAMDVMSVCLQSIDEIIDVGTSICPRCDRAYPLDSEAAGCIDIYGWCCDCADQILDEEDPLRSEDMKVVINSNGRSLQLGEADMRAIQRVRDIIDAAAFVHESSGKPSDLRDGCELAHQVLTEVLNIAAGIRGDGDDQKENQSDNSDTEEVRGDGVESGGGGAVEGADPPF